MTKERNYPLGLAWLGLAWLGLAWLGLAWLDNYLRRFHFVKSFRAFFENLGGVSGSAL